MKVLLTGASGYLGSQLVNSWLEDDRIEKIITLDLKDPQFLFNKKNSKIHFLKGNLADIDLGKELETVGPIDAVLHAAYLIRQPYFKKDLKFQEHSNFQGSENAFRFAFRNNIPKLIQFSSVAIYGARKENTLERGFIESSETQENAIAYGRDKKLIEKNLEDLAAQYRAPTQVFVLRIGSVSGPFGKNLVKKKGLQKFLRGFFPFIPVVGEHSMRQFVHEDDVIKAVNFCLFQDLEEKYLIFNVAPNEYLTFREIAKLLNKKVLQLPKFLSNLAFNLIWHLTLGKVPTPPGTINTYTYPIFVDGSKICSYGFRYDYTCLDAFLSLKGKFAGFKPQKK